MWKVFLRPILSEAVAHPIRPLKLAADSNKRYDDAKLAVTTVGKLLVKTWQQKLSTTTTSSVVV